MITGHWESGEARGGHPLTFAGCSFQYSKWYLLTNSPFIFIVIFHSFRKPNISIPIEFCSFVHLELHLKSMTYFSLSIQTHFSTWKIIWLVIAKMERDREPAELFLPKNNSKQIPSVIESLSWFEPQKNEEERIYCRAGKVLGQGNTSLEKAAWAWRCCGDRVTASLDRTFRRPE
jgi:hypothetical protein